MTHSSQRRASSATVSGAAFREMLRHASRQPPGERLISNVRCESTGGWRMRRVSGIGFFDCRLPNSRVGNAFVPLRARIEDCRFERSDLEGSIFEKVDLIDCEFAGTTLASRWDTIFSDCVFRRCRFEKVKAATFRRCTFEDVEIVDSLGTAHFDGCTVERLRVRGAFRGKFVDSSVAASDFGDAVIGEASGFVRSRMRDVMLPRGPRGYVVRDSDLLDGFEAAAPLLRPETARKLLEIGRAFRGSQSVGPVEDDYFEDLSAEERTAVLAALLPFRLDRL